MLTSAGSGGLWLGTDPRANLGTRTISVQLAKPPCGKSPPLYPHLETWLTPVTLKQDPFDLCWYYALILMGAYSWLLHGSMECSHLWNLRKYEITLNNKTWNDLTHYHNHYNLLYSIIINRDPVIIKNCISSNLKFKREENLAVFKNFILLNTLLISGIHCWRKSYMCS